jgi:predicted DNA-binding protein
MTDPGKENSDSLFFDTASQQARIDFQIPIPTYEKLHRLSKQTGKPVNSLMIELLNKSLENQ